MKRVPPRIRPGDIPAAIRRMAFVQDSLYGAPDPVTDEWPHTVDPATVVAGTGSLGAGQPCFARLKGVRSPFPVAALATAMGSPAVGTAIIGVALYVYGFDSSGNAVIRIVPGASGFADSSAGGIAFNDPVILDPRNAYVVAQVCSVALSGMTGTKLATLPTTDFSVFGRDQVTTTWPEQYLLTNDNPKIGGTNQVLLAYAVPSIQNANNLYLY